MFIFATMQPIMSCRIASDRTGSCNLLHHSGRRKFTFFVQLFQNLFHIVLDLLSISWRPDRDLDLYCQCGSGSGRGKIRSDPDPEHWSMLLISSRSSKGFSFSIFGWRHCTVQLPNSANQYQPIPITQPIPTTQPGTNHWHFIYSTRLATPSP